MFSLKCFFLAPPVPMMHFLFSIIGFQANNSNFLLRGEGCSILGFGYESPPPTRRSGNHPVGVWRRTEEGRLLPVFQSPKCRLFSREAWERHLRREGIGFDEVNRKECGRGPRAHKGNVAHYPDQVRENQNLSQGLISILKAETIIETFLSKQYPLEHLPSKWLATANKGPVSQNPQLLLKGYPRFPFV